MPNRPGYGDRPWKVTERAVAGGWDGPNIEDANGNSVHYVDRTAPYDAEDAAAENKIADMIVAAVNNHRPTRKH